MAKKRLDLSTAPLFGASDDPFKPSPEPIQQPDDLPDYQHLLEWVQTKALQGWRISFKRATMAMFVAEDKHMLVACADEMPGSHKLLQSFTSDEHNSLFVALNDLMEKMR